MSLTRISALQSCMHVSRALETVELPGLRFNINGLRLLAKGLQLTKTLKHLSLRECLLTDEGFTSALLVVLHFVVDIAPALAPSLFRNHSLTELDLSSCGLSDVSADKLSELIEVCSELVVVHL